jgi:hypothetical protein
MVTLTLLLWEWHMSFPGIVTNGTIVLDNGAQLADGTRVEVVVKSSDTESNLAGLLKFAGVVKDLPPDMARNHDHYLHGAAKK